MVRGRGGKDLTCGSGGQDEIHGGGGNDRIFGGGDSDRIEGDGGKDTIFGGPRPDLILDGGPGEDVILGGDGADSLSGDDDDDVLKTTCSTDRATTTTSTVATAPTSAGRARGPGPSSPCEPHADLSITVTCPQSGTSGVEVACTIFIDNHGPDAVDYEGDCNYFENGAVDCSGFDPSDLEDAFGGHLQAGGCAHHGASFTCIGPGGGGSTAGLTVRAIGDAVDPTCDVACLTDFAKYSQTNNYDDGETTHD